MQLASAILSPAALASDATPAFFTRTNEFFDQHNERTKSKLKNTHINLLLLPLHNPHKRIERLARACALHCISRVYCLLNYRRQQYPVMEMENKDTTQKAA